MFPLSDDMYYQLCSQGPYNNPNYPFYPMNGVGMPLPGGEFTAYAKNKGDSTVFEGKGKSLHITEYGNILATTYFQALYDPHFVLPLYVNGRLEPCRFYPGHSAIASYCESREMPRPDIFLGPRPSPVMLIGKWPSRDEAACGLHMTGSAYDHVWDVCDELDIQPAELQRWYVTSLVKFSNPDQNGGSKFPKSWIKECLPILHQELRIVRPRYILCFGADVSRIITSMAAECPNGLGDEGMRGRVVQINYPTLRQDDRQWFAVSQVMSAMHPSKVHHAPELKDDLRRSISDFIRLTHGVEIGGKEKNLDHRVIDNVEELKVVVDQILASTDPKRHIVAVDAEWHGKHHFDAGSYLRTIQFSNKEKFAVCVKLHEAGGVPAFQPNINAAISELSRLFLDPKIRIGGHFLRSDIPWIRQHTGIDLRPKYKASDSYETCLTAGGWETSLAEHALNETGLLGLEVLRAKYTDAPPYEKLLDVWLRTYCEQHGIERKDLEGFGEWDSPDFYSYACYDADVTYRIIQRLFELLPADRNKVDCRRPYWISHSASLPVLEMEENGMCVDQDRVLELSQTFTEGRNILTERLREMVNWPLFNPGSDEHCRAMLFGSQFGRAPAPLGWPDVYPEPDELKADAIKRVERAMKRNELVPTNDGLQHYIYVMPRTAQLQNLTPIVTTGDKPQSWEKVVENKEEDRFSPSTGREVLGTLGHTNKAALVLRDIRYLSKALQTTLRPPNIAKTTNEYETADDGSYVYDKGLLSFRCADGRVHTHIKQTMETGRASSSKPPLQNLANRREDDFRYILGTLSEESKLVGRYTDWIPYPMYPHSQRTIFRAGPGCVLMESDYTGAELAGIMWMAQDPQGIEDVRRNSLDPSHPEYRDIHANMAIQAFHLDCAPTKKALAAIGKAGLRVAAKNIIFGVPYGRGAEAIARQCREEGVNITVQEAQQIIDYYFTRYPRVRDFLEECFGCVTNPGYMLGCFGRVRRFDWTSDKTVRSAQERQAGNFRIQNLVADAVWTALAEMYDYREQQNIDFRFALQIHDAIMLEVPFASVGRVYREVFPICMNDRVDIWPCRANGDRLPLTEPYHLYGAREVMFRWGTDINETAEKVLGRSDIDIYELLKDPANDAKVASLLNIFAQAA